MESLKKMTLVELENVINTNKTLTPVMKQFANTRIKTLTSTPLEQVQEIVSTETITTPTPTPLVKVPKNKPGETTRTIISFTDDTKGIRAGTLVSFLENNQPGAKTKTGKVQRVFDFYDKVKFPTREEVKIKGDDGNRYYRFEKDVFPIIPTPTIPENIEGGGI